MPPGCQMSWTSAAARGRLVCGNWPRPLWLCTLCSPNAVVRLHCCLCCLCCCCVWWLSLKYYMSFISSCGNNNYANRCDAKQGKNQRWQWRGEKAQQQKEREGEAVSAACPRRRHLQFHTFLPWLGPFFMVKRAKFVECVSYKCKVDLLLLLLLLLPLPLLLLL